MVRTYKRISARKSYSEETLHHAMELVASGDLSKRQAKLQFGIPRSTMAKRLKQAEARPENLGRFKRVFNEEFERELLGYATEMQNRFYGLTITDLRSLAFELAERNGLDHPFSKKLKRAGYDWAASFMKRNQLSLRSAEPTSMARLAGFNRVQVTRFFDNLKEEFGKYGYTANQIYNVDESGITTVQNPGKVVAKRGCKQVGRVVSAEKGVTTTVVCAMNAAGNFVPPMMIFKRKLMCDRLMKGTPAGAIGVASENGWIDRDIFVKYLGHFAKQVNPSATNKILIVLDGHVSHKSLEAIDFARQHNITLITLPPHTSHKMQPLDVTFFGPLKTNYNHELNKWMVNNPGKRVAVYDIGELFASAYLKAACAEKAVNGYRATGIFPYNPDVFSETDFAPSAVTDQPLVSAQNNEKENASDVEPASPCSSERPGRSSCKGRHEKPVPSTSKARHSVRDASPHKDSREKPVPSTSRGRRSVRDASPHKDSREEPVPSTSRGRRSVRDASPHKDSREKPVPSTSKARRSVRDASPHKDSREKPVPSTSKARRSVRVKPRPTRPVPPDLRTDLPRAPMWHRGKNTTCNSVAMYPAALELTCADTAEMTSEPTRADSQSFALEGHAAESTCEKPVRTDRVSLVDIRPYPSCLLNSGNDTGRRRRKAETSAVLTSSPYKAQLEEKCKKTAQKRKLVVKHNVSKKGKKSRISTKTSKNVPASSASSPTNDQVLCIYCRQVYAYPPDEDWIACMQCSNWSHESCAPAEPGEQFVCDYCL
jgi:hypothetical protein